MWPRRGVVLVLGLLGSGFTAAAQAPAAPPAPPSAADAELLEFLGSIDGDEEGWQEYLEQRPAPRQSDAKAKPAATRPPPPMKEGAKK